MHRLTHYTATSSRLATGRLLRILHVLWSHSTMSSKRALLIGGPFGGLRGPLNDVASIENVLSGQGFGIDTCCGKDATRDGIRAAWRDLLLKITDQDVVVIYYSGHGGLVESQQGDGAESQETEQGQPLRYQFIVPIDYDRTNVGDFRGLLDIEISHLLRNTTEKTKNVTIILDCCHAGRMSRDPSHNNQAFAKNLPEVQHHDISKHITSLRAAGLLQGQTFLEGNPNVVRIAAAAATETAWEYLVGGQWKGAMTEALALAMHEADGREVSWRTTLFRVCQLVNVEFPEQHPQAEGPETRLHFSLKELSSGALPLTQKNGVAIIQAGRVAGVREGNLYAVMPHASERPDDNTKLADAKVTHLNGFQARAELTFRTTANSIPNEGALAFLLQEALYKWPAVLSEDLQQLKDAIERSKYLRCCDADEDITPLVEFRQAEGFILCTRHRVEIASRRVDNQTSWRMAFNDVIVNAEKLARAQHLLALRGENQELLNHSIETTFGIVEQGQAGRTIRTDGSDYVTEGDLVYVSLKNTGDRTVYVSVFDINVAGRISLLSKSSPMGLELPASGSYTLGNDQFGLGLRGLETFWPESVPKAKSIDERLILVLSSSPVDLRNLVDPNPQFQNRGKQTSLENLADRIVYGLNRDMGRDDQRDHIRYDMSHIPFALHPKLNYATALPAPETTKEWKDLRLWGIDPTSKVSEP